MARVALARALAVAPALPFAWGPSPAAAQSGDQTWRVSQIAGGVTVRGGPDRAEHSGLSKSDRLVAPLRIETGGDGRLTLLRGDDVLHVRPGSEAELPAEGDTPALMELFQRIGSRVFGVDSRPGRRFKVTTPYPVTLVKGTGLGFDVADTCTIVSVSEGVVGVSSPPTGERADVSAGETASVSSAPGSEISVSVTTATPAGPAAPATPATPTTSATPAAAETPASSANAAPTGTSGAAASGQGQGRSSGQGTAGGPVRAPLAPGAGDGPGGGGDGNGAGDSSTDGNGNGGGTGAMAVGTAAMAGETAATAGETAATTEAEATMATPVIPATTDGLDRAGRTNGRAGRWPATARHAVGLA